MLKNVSVLLFALLVFCMQGHSQAYEANETTQSKQPPGAAFGVPVKQNDGPKLQPEHETYIDGNVRVISTPSKDGYDLASFWIGCVVAAIAIGGVSVGIVTLRKLERQTKAAENASSAALKQAEHVVASERAWMIPKVERLTMPPPSYNSAT